MDRKLFEQIWEELEGTYEGVQVIDSKVVNRSVKYYVFHIKMEYL